MPSASCPELPLSVGGAVGHGGTEWPHVFVAVRSAGELPDVADVRGGGRNRLDPKQHNR